MPDIDFITADNAEVPHVAVYLTETLEKKLIIYIVNGNVAEAEALAMWVVDHWND